MAPAEATIPRFLIPNFILSPLGTAFGICRSLKVALASGLSPTINRSDADY